MRSAGGGQGSSLRGAAVIYGWVPWHFPCKAPRSRVLYEAALENTLQVKPGERVSRSGFVGSRCNGAGSPHPGLAGGGGLGAGTHPLQQLGVGTEKVLCELLGTSTFKR